MATTWYAKVDCNLHQNRKVMQAGRIGREVWVFVLCMNAQRGALGEFPAADLEPWYVAHHLQIPQAEAVEGIDRCLAAGLIEITDGLVRLLGWDEDYGKYPLSNNERQERHRRRQRQKAGTPGVGVTTNSNESNGQSVTVSRTDNGESRPVTQVGRKEGREGEALAPATPDQDPAQPAEPYDPGNEKHRGTLAKNTWARLNDLRARVAAELGLPMPTPYPRGDGIAQPPGFRELSSRIREECEHAPRTCQHVLEVLVVQARQDRSIEWLSDKAFTEGGWRTARNKTPTWRSSANTNEPAPVKRKRVAYVGGREVALDD